MRSQRTAKKLLLLALAFLWPITEERVSARAIKDIERETLEDSEEYLVYSKVLVARYEGKEIKNFVISKATASKEKDGAYIGTVGGLTFSGAKRPDVGPDISGDFDAKYEKSANLANKFPIDIPYSVVAAEDLKNLFHKDGEMIGRDEWGAFYKKYPGSSGIIAFSRVGFNQNKNQALVYVLRQSGLVGGAGMFYVLSKENGSWKIQKESERGSDLVVVTPLQSEPSLTL